MDFPAEDALVAIVERYARLLSDVESELGPRGLVLPNGQSFPDRFTPDAEGARTLVARMLAHAGLEDVPLTTRVVDEFGAEAESHGCSSGCQVPAEADGSVPRLVDDGEGWTLNVPAYELMHPVVLTSTIARALGHVFLVESLPPGRPIEAPADLTADYAAVALGLGPLLLEGAYVYSKGCGGPRVAQVTRAGLSELGVLTALHLRMGGHSLRATLKDLGTTQAAVLREAHEWAESNGELVAKLLKDPARVAAGDYELASASPWLVRLFKKKPRKDEAPATRSKPAALDPKVSELRALVDEALSASHSEAE
jgi:hypothetical protein